MKKKNRERWIGEIEAESEWRKYESFRTGRMMIVTNSSASPQYEIVPFRDEMKDWLEKGKSRNEDELY